MRLQEIGAGFDGGSGLSLSCAWHDAPFHMLTMHSPHGLCALGFAGDKMARDAVFTDLRRRFPNAAYRFEASPEAFDLSPSLHLIGTAFQLRVWQALLRIPLGQTSHYSALAQQIGAPQAVRAVGTAVGRNPVSFFVPCHRVLRKDGGMGGYHWGLAIKEQLLSWERGLCAQ